MKNKELIKNVPSSEKVLEWNAKETVAGSQEKANTAFEQAKAYADEHKIEKIEGKGLSSEDFTKAEKDKLASLENYVHPEKHTTTDITTNSDARFVSDSQISSWDAKETVDGSQGKADKALADSKAYTEQEIDRIDNIKLDSAEIQNRELIFKANEIEKFRIVLPSGGIDKLPIATNTELGAIKVGAGLSVTQDGILSATGGGVADSVAWDNIVGKPERFPAMEHIHELATTELDGFMSKADKVKLNGLQNYTHPETHPASMIVEDSTHKFVSEEQIAIFNDKYTKVETNNLLKRKFDNVDISGNTLRFYADSIKKYEIEIPVADFNTIINKPDTFNPPIATSEVLGGVKVGTGLSITEDGIINVINAHSHNNLSSLEKITEDKLTEWNAKETVSGAQEKSDKALSDAKKYIDSLIKTTKLKVNIFEYDESSKMYKATVRHNLSAENIIINVLDSVTKENELLSYKVIDENTIEIATPKEVVNGVDLFIIGGGLLVSTNNLTINDSAIALDSAWSSQKVKNMFDEQTTHINENKNEIDKIKENVTTISNDVEQLKADVQTGPDLSGYATLSALSRAGECQINGENIQTGTLSVDLIKSNNENPIITLFDNCALDATANMNQGKGNSIRLKWDDYNYIKISSDDIAFYNNGKSTLRVGNQNNAVISFYEQTSIDATSFGETSIRLRADDNNYLKVSSTDARFYINGRAVVKINGTGIVQGIPATVNELPISLTTESGIKFSDFVENEFANSVALNDDNKLILDTNKITDAEISNLLLDEEGNYSYASCIAVLASALKEEIKARKALEQKVLELNKQQK